MPIEIDFLSRLATPQLASFIAFLVILMFSIIFYALPRKLGERARQSYIPRIQFIAEVLVSVGIIGLISLAGRAKFEFDAVELKQAAFQTESVAAASFYPYAVSECISGVERRISSQDALAISVVCKIWKDFNNVHDPKLPWLEASRELSVAANIETLHPKLREDIEAMVSAIDRVQKARDSVAIIPLKRDMLTRENSWVFVLFCAFSACLGIALKCARAALQLRGNNLV